MVKIRSLKQPETKIPFFVPLERLRDLIWKFSQPISKKNPLHIYICIAQIVKVAGMDKNVKIALFY